MPSRRVLAVAAVVAALALIAVAVVYWAEPARSLPGMFPGHDAASAHHHVKHGIAAMIAALALLAYAWFASASPDRPGDGAGR